MKDIIDFLYANPIGCLATVDDNGQPHVRPWMFMFEQDGKLWFHTSNIKDVFCQLQCHPSVEFCSTAKDLTTVRVKGDVIFGIDMNIKKKMLNMDEQLKAIFQTPENPELEIFYIKHGQVTIHDCTGQTLKTMVVF